MRLDRVVLEEILYVTCSILKKHFFYDDESIARFLHVFTHVAECELDCFDQWASEEVRLQLRFDRKARSCFTSFFVSANLRNVMIHYLHFSESELQAFENFLPNYSEVIENVESCNQRAHH
jgi:hypothetical protein